MAAAAPGAPRPGERERAGRPEPVLQSLQSIWRELPGLLSDRVDLLTLELERASAAVVRICVLVVAAAIFGVTAWLALWVGIVASLLAFGVPLLLALLMVLALNGAAAWLAIGGARRALPDVSLPATRRHLTLTPSPDNAPHPPPAPARPRHDHANRPTFSPTATP